MPPWGYSASSLGIVGKISPTLQELTRGGAKEKRGKPLKTHPTPKDETYLSYITPIIATNGSRP
ncbi:hypothetical protein GCM10007981_09480 [Thermocladium modestius]|uniref:Uncharacterized protein n=1 Tax=Thermocladium modestius TaxID=62609 RepID=A0A830GVL2_9CREN|nr:hypothetical protein GCM10007981_09480 [Thermocladium modestius]